MKNLELAGGENMVYSAMLLQKLLGMTIPSADDIKKEKEKFKAICILLRSDEFRYGVLLGELCKSAYLVRDEYPQTLSLAYHLLLQTSNNLNYKRTVKNPARYNHFTNQQRSGNNYTFTQKGTMDKEKNLVPGSDGNSHEGIKCYTCQHYGHYTGQCPKNGTNTLAIVCTQFKHRLMLTCILLDTFTTHSVSNNAGLVTNIRPCAERKTLTIDMKGGPKTFRSKAELKMLPIHLYYDKSSLASILSFKDVANIPSVRVTMDTDVEKAIVVCLKMESYSSL